MSTPTTTRGGLLRRAGTLLAAAALVAAPATNALADPSEEASPTVTMSASPSATEPVEPSPTTSTPTVPAPTTTGPAPRASTPSPTSTSPAATPNPTPDAGNDRMLVSGGKVASFGPAAVEGPATSTDPALVAANYLERELATTGFVLQSFGYPDHGLTADAILALDAAGTGQLAAAAATAALAEDPVAYIGFGDPNEIAAGAVAKLISVAVAQGIDPSSFGGYDLVSTLQGLEKPSGRFSDVSSQMDWQDPTKPADYSNVFTQAFALIGLERAGVSVSPAALSMLVAQQCPGGGFQLDLADAGCSDDANAEPDATAMAVQALLAVGGASTEVENGLDYLTARQQSSGGVGGGGPTSAVNANSTGLAGQAFLAGGRTTQASSAVGYLTALQYGCDFPASLRGGIAYDQTSYEKQSDAGADAAPADEDRRSTSQALLALSGTPLASVTAEGAAATAPSLTCAAPTTTTPGGGRTTTAAPTSTSGGGGASGGGSTPANGTPTAPAAAAPSGSLAQTGSDLLLPVGLGLALVVVGGVTLVLSRRRGAHA